MSTPTVPSPPPSTTDSNEPVYQDEKILKIKGIKEKVEVEFIMFNKNYNDDGIDRVAGTLLIYIDNRRVGDMLIESNFDSESEFEKWTPKADAYEYETKLADRNKNAFEKYVNEKLTSIKQYVEGKLTEKREALTKKFPEEIAEQILKENAGEETTFDFQNAVKDNKYGPFLFANLWLMIENKDTTVDDVPYDYEIAKAYIDQIEEAVSGWRKNHYEDIFPPNIALFALFLFSEENKESIEPSILTVVKDIKNRCTTEISNTEIVGTKVGEDNENLILTDMGQQLMLLLIA